jgi:hypothetical protein
MSLLAAAKKPQAEPMIATIVGNPGSGKTSLAATFPRPFLIRVTGESVPRDIPLDRMPDTLDEVSKAAQLWAQLMALVEEEHSYETAIIDSVTGLDTLFAQDVLDSDPKARGLNQALGGYGAGQAAVTASHMRVRKAAEALRKRRGMNVVFIAHADITRIDPPDSDGFSQYSLRMNNKSMSPYVDAVDLVGFLKQSTVLMGDDGNKKAISTGERVLTTYLTPASISKNRYGIEEDLEVAKGENPLAAWLGRPETEVAEEPAKRGRPRKAETEVNSEEGNEA